jgi:hypothetical protein
MDCGLPLEILLGQGLGLRDPCICGFALGRHSTHEILLERERRQTQRERQEHEIRIEQEKQRTLQLETATNKTRNIPLSSVDTDDLNILIGNFQLGPTQQVDEFPYEVRRTGQDFGEFQWTTREVVAPNRLVEDEDLSIDAFGRRIRESLENEVPEWRLFDVHEKQLFFLSVEAQRVVFRGKTDLVFLPSTTGLPQSNLDILRGIRFLIEAKTNHAFAENKAKLINQATAEFILALAFSRQNIVHACLTTGAAWVFFWLARHEEQMCVHRCELELSFTDGLLHVAELLKQVSPHRLFEVEAVEPIPRGNRRLGAGAGGEGDAGARAGGNAGAGTGTGGRAGAGATSGHGGAGGHAGAGGRAGRAKVDRFGEGSLSMTDWLVSQEDERITSEGDLDCEDDGLCSDAVTEDELDDYADVAYENWQRFLRVTMNVAECDFLRPEVTLTSEALASHNKKSLLTPVI